MALVRKVILWLASKVGMRMGCGIQEALRRKLFRVDNVYKSSFYDKITIFLIFLLLKRRQFSKVLGLPVLSGKTGRFLPFKTGLEGT